MKKLLTVLVLALVPVFGVLAGNTCKWTGGAHDGKWSSEGNWDIKPTSGSDTLDFSAASGIVCNDLGTFTVAKLIFAGSQPVTVAGDAITFLANNAEVWENVCKVTLDVPLSFAGHNTFTFQIKGSVDFNKPVSISGGDMTMCLTGPSKDPDSKSIVVNFYDTVSGNILSLGYGMGSNTYFHKPVALKSMTTSPNYNLDNVHFCSTGNKINTLQPCYERVYAECENAWDPTQVFKFGEWYQESGTASYNLQTYDQTISAIDSGKTHGLVTSSGARLTLRLYLYDYGFNGKVSGQTTIIVDSPEGRAQSFYNTTAHDTTGDIIVSNGTFNVGAQASFASVPNAYVAANGTLKSASTSGTRAFGGLKTLTLEPGAHFTIDSAASAPLTDGRTVLYVSQGSVVSAPGKTLAFKMVFVDGVAQPVGTYTAANAPWITNDGTTVSAAETVNQWTASDGYWDEGTKWLLGVPDGTAKTSVTKPSDSYVVTIRTANATPGEMEIDNAKAGETATVLVKENLSLPGSPVTVGAGGVLAVSNAAVLSVAAQSADADSLRVEKGGRLVFGDSAKCIVENADKAALRPLKLCGGEVVFGGTSRYEPGCGWYKEFGSGKIVFAENAVYAKGTTTGSDQRHNWAPDGDGDENAFDITFTDQAALRLDGSDSLYVNSENVGGHRVKVTLDSLPANEHVVGSLLCGLGGETEWTIKRGKLGVNAAGGVYVGSRASQYSGLTGASAATATVTVVEGATLNVAGGWSPNRGVYLGDGPIIGTGGRMSKGVLNLGGSMTDWYGYIMVGLGRGEGEINVVGGSFETMVNASLPPKPMVVGFASGLGRVNVSNGTFDLGVRPAYVGGGTLVELGLDGAMPADTHYEDMHDATGTVTVAAADLSKPCRFTTTSDIYVGKDGVGTLSLGAGGLIKATGTIALCNGAHSTLKFVCSPNGTGKIECDKLIVSQGAKLIVDVSACEIGGKGQKLVVFNSKEGEFATSDMELVGVKPGMTYRLVQRENGIRLSSGMGLILVVE